MISGSVARRYAKALLSIGVDGKNFEQLGAELTTLVKTIEGSAELKGVLESPVFPQSQRKAILGEILARLHVSKVVEHFALLLVDHNRMNALVGIDREMRALVDEQAGRVRATIVSARPLEPAVEGRIKAALEQPTGKKVIVEKREDASLIGGVVAQIGDMVYDGSVKAQLSSIRDELLAK